MLGLILGLIALFVGSFFYMYHVPYARFLEDDNNAHQKFSESNDKLFAQLPIPPGVNEVSRSESRSGSELHGAILYVDFVLKGQSLVGVIDYYEAYFSQIGWDDFLISDYSGPNVVFYKTNACVEIFPTIDGYELQIYHDYFNVEFTPKIPKVIAWHEFYNGGPQYIRCPPFLDPQF